MPQNIAVAHVSYWFKLETIIITLENHTDHKFMKPFFGTESWRGSCPETELLGSKSRNISKPPELLEGKGMKALYAFLKTVKIAWKHICKGQ